MCSNLAYPKLGQTQTFPFIDKAFANISFLNCSVFHKTQEVSMQASGRMPVNRSRSRFFIKCPAGACPKTKNLLKNQCME